MRYDPPAKTPPPGPAPTNNEKTGGKSLRKLVWRVLVPTAVVLLGALAGVGFAGMIRMPRVDSLADFTPSLITELFDRDGRVFATYAREKRVLLDEGEIPELLQQAILAAEDANFFQHGGVDAQGVARAAFKNLGAGRKAMGGSTITMQLARQLYLNPKKTWRRKIEEALLAVELEKTYAKQQILTLYANLIFFGHGNYGFEAAARSFFDKSVEELTLPEAAMLAGIPQRPSTYSPYRRPDLVLARRDYVLRRMWEEGFVTEEEYRAATTQPLQVVPRRPQDLLAPYFSEEVRRYLEAQYGAEGLLQRGLQVATTLDPQIQRAAEEALRTGLLRLDHRKGWRGPLYRVEDVDLETHQLASWSQHEVIPGAWLEGLVVKSNTRSTEVRIANSTFELTAEGIDWTRRERASDLLKAGDVAWFRIELPEEGEGEPLLVLEQEPELEGAALVLESSSGAVRAMVGGWDFERSSFNRATQAKRQVGSAFKAFVYGAALENGFTAADTIFDSPVIFEGANNVPNYSPRNFYRQYNGIVTLRRALEKSMNVSSVKLMDMVGAERVIDLARRFGVTTDLQPYPSLALGAAELIPLELAAAYATIANQGIYVEPYLIESITTPDGHTLEQHRMRAHKAMEADVAFVLTHMLAGVIDRGTGASVAGLDLDLGGKTGTTDIYTDAWFVGFTPRYTLLSWVGYDVPRSLGRNMTGAEAALPIWKMMVESGLEDGWLTPGGQFSPPPGVALQRIEYSTGLLPGPGAGQVIDEAFIQGTQPARQYEPEWARIMRMPWYQQRPYYIPKAGERMPEDVEDWTLIREVWAEKDKKEKERRQ
jgi:penicillin-binding protein 1A